MIKKKNIVKVVIPPIDIEWPIVLRLVLSDLISMPIKQR